MWNRETASRDEGQRPVPPSVVAPVAPTTPAVAVAPLPARAAVDERCVVAWIGKSVLFRGDLISLEDIKIDGRVEGTIELRDHTLTIGSDANIQADIVAKIVAIHGKVTGAITASETVSISETGTVEGNITSRRLSMADGAVVKGQVDTGTRAGDQAAQQPKATTTVN